MKYSIIIVGLAALVAAGVWAGHKETESEKIACTMEAKLCPDGSYVGRTGPNCAFAPCPSGAATTKGVISGRVTLGPTCPVERIPPDPACAPRPYETTVIAKLAGKSTEAGRAKSDANGHFSLSLAPGTYDVSAIGGNVYPRCESQRVAVAKGATTTITLICDTGIR